MNNLTKLTFAAVLTAVMSAAADSMNLRNGVHANDRGHAVLGGLLDRWFATDKEGE